MVATSPPFTVVVGRGQLMIIGLNLGRVFMNPILEWNVIVKTLNGIDPVYVDMLCNIVQAQIEAAYEDGFKDGEKKEREGD